MYNRAVFTSSCVSRPLFLYCARSSPCGSPNLENVRLGSCTCALLKSRVSPPCASPPWTCRRTAITWNADSDERKCFSAPWHSLHNYPLSTACATRPRVAEQQHQLRQKSFLIDLFARTMRRISDATLIHPSLYPEVMPRCESSCSVFLTPPISCSTCVKMWNLRSTQQACFSLLSTRVAFFVPLHMTPLSPYETIGGTQGRSTRARACLICAGL